MCKVFSITLIPLEMSAFLKTSSITAANSVDNSGVPCLTHHFIGNSLNTNLSKWVLNVTWLRMFCRIFIYVSFMLFFLKALKMAKCSTVSKIFS